MSGPIAVSIREELLAVAQETLVAELQVLLDDCYLQILLEVFENGNRSGLKLRKLKATIDPSAYRLPIDETDHDDARDWFDIRGLIGDLVRAFKFEPYKEKLEVVTRALDFKPDETIVRELRKHVLLRNCIQHQEGQVTEDTLQQFGATKFLLQGDDGSSYELGAWSAIKFSFSETAAFADVLAKFATSLDTTAGTRVRTKYWEPIA